MPVVRNSMASDFRVCPRCGVDLPEWIEQLHQVAAKARAEELRDILDMTPANGVTNWTRERVAARLAELERKEKP